MPLSRLLVAVTMSACAVAAQAVHVSPDGSGQGLLFPYYTARGSHDTLFSVVNQSAAPAAKALKVRFLEGRHGRTVLQFNLYLDKGRTWTAAVTRNGAGEPILRTWDPSCTVPLFQAGTVAGAMEIAFGNAGYAGHDQAGSGLDRALEGHFEVIEMGVVNEDFILAEGRQFGPTIVAPTTAGAAPGQHCATVAAAWTGGGAFLASAGAELSAPTGDLHGHGIIINVPQGTEYSFEPVALGQLFASSRHTGPDDVHPHLGDADPASTVMVGGTVRQSTWSAGIDAVSAVLTHRQVLNEYVGPPTTATGAASDLVFTFPTRSFYVVRESDAGLATRPPFSARFDDTDATGAPLADGTSTGACEPVSGRRHGRDNLRNYNAGIYFVAPPGEDFAALCWQSGVVSLGNVLGSANAVALTTETVTAGRIEVSLDTIAQHELTSNEGHRYAGLPVVGFAVQRRLNGSVDGVLSNYGGVSLHKYRTTVQ